MPGKRSLTALQVHVATVFFSLEASRGFLVAGGSALIARSSVVRSMRLLATCSPVHL